MEAGAATVPARPSGGERGDVGGDELIAGDWRAAGTGQRQAQEVVGHGVGGAIRGSVHGDGGEGAAEEALAEGAGLFRDEGAQGGHALLHGAGRDRLPAVQLPGRRAGTRRKREEVEIGEGLCGDEVVALLKERVGFAREADHDVGADGGVGEQSADGGQPLGVMPGAIAAVHAAQDGVRSGLQRQVGVAG